jgi:hypothetical protein
MEPSKSCGKYTNRAVPYQMITSEIGAWGLRPCSRKQDFGMSNRKYAFSSASSSAQIGDLKIENQRLRKIARDLLLENMKAQRALDHANGEPPLRKRTSKTIAGMSAGLSDQ